MTYTTSELPLAAYLRMKGVKLMSAKKGVTGKFEFVFDDNAGVCHRHMLDYLNSDFNTFDAQIKSLKKMIYTK